MTRFYFVAAAASPQGEASSLSLAVRAFQEASSMGDLSAAATATVLVAGERTQNLYILNESDVTSGLVVGRGKVAPGKLIFPTRLI